DDDEVFVGKPRHRAIVPLLEIVGRWRGLPEPVAETQRRVAVQRRSRRHELPKGGATVAGERENAILPGVYFDVVDWLRRAERCCNQFAERPTPKVYAAGAG